MASNEPTPQERQRLAFQLLKQEALEAHREGNGLKVNLLCQTAFDGIEQLIKNGQFRLPLREVQWAFIFQSYWLLNHFGSYLAAETLKKVPRVDTQDEEIAAFLKCHQYLIQPLSGHSGFEMVKGLPLDVLSKEKDPPLEEAELLTHIGELVWFRSAGGGEWRDFLKRWERHKVRWISELASSLRRRLELQTRMVFPCSNYPIVEEASIQDVRADFELADLWLLHLHGRGEATIKRVRELLPNLTPNSYQWRIVSDFWHISRPFGPSDDGEQQGRWLARRRSLTADSPLLLFHDRREMRIGELLGELFRERVASNASLRREVMLLAMLHEIAAMRLWDYGMWREATRAQSEAWLEATLWMPDQPRYAAHGLALGASALSLKSSSKDSLTRTAVERLEFAPVDVLLNLADRLLAAYPKQKFSASELMDEIADLLPPDTWPRLAEWTTAAIREMNEKRSTGEKIAPAAFWCKIIPSLEEHSPVWNILLPEALRMAGCEFCWDGALLSSWIRYSPLNLSRQVAEAILQATPGEKIFSLHRAELLVNAENNRPELHHEFTKRLPRPAPANEERMLLADHLDIDQDHSEAIAARETIAKKLVKRIELMLLPEADAKSKVPFERLGLARVKLWEDQHQPLFEKLLSALHHPDLRADYIPELLNVLQLMIAYGPPGFSIIARPSVESWVLEPPGSGAESNAQESPFSIVHRIGPDAGAVQEQLGWLVFQYVRREGAAAADLVGAMVDKSLQCQWQEPTGILCFNLIVLTSKLSGTVIRENMIKVYQLLDALRAQIRWDLRAASNLTEALRRIVGLVGPQHASWIDWHSEQGRIIAPELIRILEVILSAAAESPRVNLRVEAACVLVFLQKWQDLPAELKTLLDRLTHDRRARVRIAARA